STEKLLSDNSEKISQEINDEVRTAVDELKTALEGEDFDEISAKQQAVLSSSQKIGEALYSEQQAAEAGAGNPGASAQAGGGAAGESAQSGGEEEDVVDAEIVDEDEEK